MSIIDISYLGIGVVVVVMLINSVEDIQSTPLLYQLDDFVEGVKVIMSLEGLNVAGSIKLKSARYMLDALEAKTQIEPERSTIIESSSGNLGVALSILCRNRGYNFICVTDNNITRANEKLMLAYGAEVIKVSQADSNGGYLNTRIDLINNLLKKHDNYYWLNQYNNHANILAHYHMTAAPIFKEIPNIDYLFVGAGTTGTLMGCCQYFRKYSPKTKLIAVDVEGSVTFGLAPQKRKIPGLGTSRKPEIADPTLFDDLVIISESQTIEMCRLLMEQNTLLLGGSSGTVMSAVRQYQEQFCKGATVVTISPDFGNKYIDMIYL